MYVCKHNTYMYMQMHMYVHVYRNESETHFSHSRSSYVRKLCIPITDLRRLTAESVNCYSHHFCLMYMYMYIKHVHVHQVCTVEYRQSAAKIKGGGEGGGQADTRYCAIFAP